MKFDRRLTFEDHVRDIVSSVSQRISILRLMKLVFVGHLCFLRCYYAHVLPNTSIVLRCGYLLLDVIFSFSTAWCIWWPCRLCPDQTFLSLCHRRHVAALCMLSKVNSKSRIVCSVSFYLLLSEFDILELQQQLIH